MGCDTEVEREQIDKYEFNTADKRITVYPSPEPDSPIVYINTFEGEGDNVYRALENMDNPAFTLVAVSGLKWEHDMARGISHRSRRKALPVSEAPTTICSF